MKKLIVFILTAVISLSFITPAYADWDDDWKKNHKNYYDYDDDYDDDDDDKGKGKKQKKAKKYKAKKTKFKTKNSPVIKYGRYKLPISPVTKGMDAEVDYDDGVLTVTKDDISIVIDFKKEKVTINGTIDRSSDIFKKKNNNGMTVLTKYIAKILNIRVDFDDDEIIVENPKLDKPRNITVTPVGSTITSTDTTVTFSTSDGTPTNEELKALVPKGGEILVKLYNKNNEYVTAKAKDKLIVDYVAPTITGITSANYDHDKQELTIYVKVDYLAPTLTKVNSVIYNRPSHQLYFTVTDAGAAGDFVDVTMITVHDLILGRSYQLTSSKGGSKGIINSENSLVVNLGELDRNALAKFDTSNMYITISKGSLIKDESGNSSPNSLDEITIPLIVIK